MPISWTVSCANCDRSLEVLSQTVVMPGNNNRQKIKLRLRLGNTSSSSAPQGSNDPDHLQDVQPHPSIPSSLANGFSKSNHSSPSGGGARIEGPSSSSQQPRPASTVVETDIKAFLKANEEIIDSGFTVQKLPTHWQILEVIRW